MTSYHEAAPMVIDEACALGLPILTTETTSAHDMVAERQCGWVCENTDMSFIGKLEEILSELDKLVIIKESLRGRKVDNDQAFGQFRLMIDASPKY